jgi:prepilin-type N-terminal cleavage/methylation domain-containing protein
MKSARKSKPGFTLIELLLVVVIISILSGVVISIINVSGVRNRAEDAQRIADLKKIQAALESYFSDNRQYPSTAGNWINLGTPDNVVETALSGTGGNPVYLSVLPSDPDPEVSLAASPCEPVAPRYNYVSDGYYYFMTAIMDLETTNEGAECSALSSFTLNASGTRQPVSFDTTCSAGFQTQEVCYGVRNP